MLSNIFFFSIMYFNLLICEIIGIVGLHISACYKYISNTKWRE